MDKYIKREDLGEAMEAIARCAIENADSFRTEINITKGWKENVEIRVTVRNNESFRSLAEDAFIVVDAVRPAEYCDTLLAAIDLQKVELEAEEE